MDKYSQGGRLGPGRFEPKKEIVHPKPGRMAIVQTIIFVAVSATIAAGLLAIMLK